MAMNESRRHASSGSPWEVQVGYSRAVRVGPFISVSGTTATGPDGEVVGVGDAYAQTHFALEIVGRALAELGASISDVVRTRMYVTDIEDWPAIGRAHGEVFGDVRPAATMVEVSRLIDKRHLVEIEVDAIVADGNESAV